MSNFIFLQSKYPDLAAKLMKAEKFYVLHGDEEICIDLIRKATNCMMNYVMVYENTSIHSRESLFNKLKEVSRLDCVPNSILNLMNEIRKDRNISYYQDKPLNHHMLYYFSSMFSISRWFCYRYSPEIVLPTTFRDPFSFYAEQCHVSTMEDVDSEHILIDDDDVNKVLAKFHNEYGDVVVAKIEQGQRHLRSLEIVHQMRHDIEGCLDYFEVLDERESHGNQRDESDGIIIDVDTVQVKQQVAPNTSTKSKSNKKTNILLLIGIVLLLYSVVQSKLNDVYEEDEVKDNSYVMQSEKVGSDTEEVFASGGAVEDMIDDDMVEVDAIKNVDVVLDRPELYVGESAQFDVAVEMVSEGLEVPVITYESTNKDVVAIDELGRVQAISAGNAMIYIGVGDYVTEQRVSVKEVQKVDAAVMEFESPTIYVGEKTAVIMDIKMKREGGPAPEVIYQAANPEVAIVTDEGEVLGLNPGVGTIYAEVGGLVVEAEIVVQKPAKYELETLVAGPQGHSDGVFGKAKITSISDFVQIQSGDIYFLDSGLIRKYTAKTKKIETIPIDNRFDYVATDLDGAQCILNHSNFKPESLTYDAKTDTVYVASDTILYRLYPQIKFEVFSEAKGDMYGKSGLVIDHVNDEKYFMTGGADKCAISRIDDSDESTILKKGNGALHEEFKLYGSPSGIVQGEYMYLGYGNGPSRIMKVNLYTHEITVIYFSEGTGIGVYDENYFITFIDGSFVKLSVEGKIEEVLLSREDLEDDEGNEIVKPMNIQRDTEGNILFSTKDKVNRIKLKK